MQHDARSCRASLSICGGASSCLRHVPRRHRALRARRVADAAALRRRPSRSARSGERRARRERRARAVAHAPRRARCADADGASSSGRASSARESCRAVLRGAVRRWRACAGALASSVGALKAAAFGSIERRWQAAMARAAMAHAAMARAAMAPRSDCPGQPCPGQRCHRSGSDATMPEQRCPRSSVARRTACRAGARMPSSDARGGACAGGALARCHPARRRRFPRGANVQRAGGTAGEICILPSAGPPLREYLPEARSRREGPSLSRREFTTRAAVQRACTAPERSP